jgi:hypothetical protein
MQRMILSGELRARGAIKRATGDLYDFQSHYGHRRNVLIFRDY